MSCENRQREHNNMMPLGQPESVPLARSEDSFSDDGLRSEPSFGSLQELEYVDRWPSEAPPPPSDDEGPRTPRIGPALSLDEDDDDARAIIVVLVQRERGPDARRPRALFIVVITRWRGRLAGPAVDVFQLLERAERGLAP